MKERAYYLRSDIVQYEAALRMAERRGDAVACAKLRAIVADRKRQLAEVEGTQA